MHFWTCAARQLSKLMGRSINESTARKMKCEYLEELKKRKKCAAVPTVTFLPTKHQGRPLLLGKEVDTAVQDGIASLRKNKAVVNTRIVMAEYLVVGDLCVFKATPQFKIPQFKIGKVLQFILFDKNGKTGKGKRLSYKGNYASSTRADCGVMCTWYEREVNTRTYKLANSDATYHSIKAYYACTLSEDCLEHLSIQPAQLGFKPSTISTECVLTLTEECIGYIEQTVKTEAEMVIDLSTEESSDKKPSKGKRTTNEKIWVKCGKIVLTTKDKNIIQNGSKLTDIQVNVSQQLLKKEFSSFNGFQFTLYQLKHPLDHKENAIQILHVDKNHLAVISTVGCMEAQIKYYDSSYSALSTSAEHIIAQLMSPHSKYEMQVEIMDIPKQSGSTDCGLYAIAISTAIAYGSDPQELIFIQSDMQVHLIDCIQKQSMKEFPVKQKHRSRAQANPKFDTIYVCPKCYKPDDGTMMVQCESCEVWFHKYCVMVENHSCNFEEDWYCYDCEKTE